MSKKGGNTGGNRPLKVRVKTAKMRKASSTRWLERQLNDPYVHRAKREGYRSRAAFKLIELDDRFHFLKSGQTVIDLGAAPGGWSQVAAERTKSPDDVPRVVGMDLLAISAIPGVTLLQYDFTKDDAPEKLKQYMPSGAEVVLSDMAPNTIGHAATDHLRLMALLEMALAFAVEVLKPGGTFVAKVFQGGAEKELLTLLRKHFSVVKHAKPSASRSDSSELYIVAMGFRQ